MKNTYLLVAVIVALSATSAQGASDAPETAAVYSDTSASAYSDTNATGIDNSVTPATPVSPATDTLPQNIQAGASDADAQASDTTNTSDTTADDGDSSDTTSSDTSAESTSDNSDSNS